MEGKYVWKDEFNTGVNFIDEQHRFFFHILADLQACLNAGSCGEEASKLFYRLAHYAEHFLIQEEIYFKDYDFPSLKEHKQLHESFIKRVIRFKREFTEDVEHTCRTMFEYLDNWFDNHILKYDMEAIEYLREKGL